jgi:putative Holliday junction resolvase
VTGTAPLVAPLRPAWQIAPVRILALDVGSKRIGVAISDELGLFAHPLSVLARKGTAADVATLRALCVERSVERVVVGIPSEPDGGEGHRAARVRVLLEALRAAGLRVDECDEQYSTVEAEAVMLEAGLSRARRRKVVDRAAAAVILERYLAGRAPARTP